MLSLGIVLTQVDVIENYESLCLCSFVLMMPKKRQALIEFEVCIQNTHSIYNPHPPKGKKVPNFTWI